MFALYPRLRAMGVVGYATNPDDVRLLPERLSTPLTWKKPRHVFVNSMADLFHHRVPFDFVFETFDVMRKAASERGHVFQVLTKRPGRVVAWWNQYEERFPEGWPPNVWIGTSVESQKYAPRLTVLERLPAPVRFVSAEPLLERLELADWLDRGALQWVIVGGEKRLRRPAHGPRVGARPARSIQPMPVSPSFLSSSAASETSAAGTRPPSTASIGDNCRLWRVCRDFLRR